MGGNVVVINLINSTVDERSLLTVHARKYTERLITVKVEAIYTFVSTHGCLVTLMSSLTVTTNKEVLTNY